MIPQVIDDINPTVREIFEQGLQYKLGFVECNSRLDSIRRIHKLQPKIESQPVDLGN